MRILIVGGTSSLAHALRPVLAEFAEVIIAGRAGCDVYLDLTDPAEKIEILRDADVVINAAAHFGGNSFAEMLAAEQVNVLGALKLCQACTKAKVRHLVSISSINACLGEASSYYGIYSLSKKQADEVVQLFCSSFNLPYTILRPSQLYGNEDTFRKHQTFLYASIDKAETDKDINIYGNHDALRNYLHIEDLAKIISLVITKEVKGLYSCTNMADVSFSAIAKAAIEAFHSTSRVVFLKEMKDIEDNVFPYDYSLYKMLDYFPQISMAEGVKRIASYRLSQS